MPISIPPSNTTLTPEQRLRAVDVLEEKLGFQGQSRVVVMHDKHGRAHLHVVWCRMDYDTGTLRSDSQNYLKHEKASLQLEREFGHEIVPGNTPSAIAKSSRNSPVRITTSSKPKWLSGPP